MSARYEAHQLNGYTDGKPSWRKVPIPHFSTYSKEGVEEALAAFRVIYPAATFRVRKSQPKRANGQAKSSVVTGAK